MKKVECKGCGWSWDLNDGGSDPYVCHKCGEDNTDYYKLKIKVSKEDQDYINEAIKNGEVLVEDLGRWFKEKWVDVSRKIDGKHPPCGRSSANGEKKRKGYPKCRPSKKVSKDTPKVASSYSKKEKKSMTTQKRSAEKKDPKVGKGNKPTMTRFDENELLKITNLVMEQLNSEITYDDLECLKKINNLINRQEVIQWFNDNDVDYYNMSDIEMYIMYIEKNMDDDSDLGSVEETDFIPDELLNEAEYKGRKVRLGKIMQGDVKKFKVYVKNDKGNVVKVNFGFGGKSAKGKVMKIKKNNPERRKSFRARHKCDNPGPRWKARYWACKTW
jgi:ribosome assembly protein YihI (activator of Der GTPase)